MRSVSVAIPSLDVEYYHDGAYELKEDHPRWHRWIQRACFWLLERLHCQQWGRRVSYTQNTVVFDDVVDAILSQKYAVEAIWHLDCRAVVLGREQIHALRLDDQYLVFSLPDDMASRMHPYALGRKFAGLTVILCPWLDGIVTLPSVDVLSTER